MAEFLALCVEKDIEKRPSARDLLEHVWVKRSLEKTLRMESQSLFNIYNRIIDLIEDWRKDDFRKMINPKEKDLFDSAVQAEYSRNRLPKYTELRDAKTREFEKVQKEKAAKRKRRSKIKDEDDDEFMSDDEFSEYDDDKSTLGSDDASGWVPEEFDSALGSQDTRARKHQSFNSIEPTSVEETPSLEERYRRRMKREVKLREQLKKEKVMEFSSRRDLRGDLEGKLSGLKVGKAKERENAKAFSKMLKAGKKNQKKG